MVGQHFPRLQPFVLPGKLEKHPPLHLVWPFVLFRQPAQLLFETSQTFYPLGTDFSMLLQTKKGGLTFIFLCFREAKMQKVKV
jgi:hypothetical protein